MFKSPEDFESDALLHQGLSSLPVPEVSSDFNTRVHAALQRPTPWWKPLWANLRPVLAAAACSLVVTLALLQGLSDSPGRPQRLIAANTNRLASAQARERMNVLDNDMERMDLSGASWHLFTILWWSLTAQVSSPLESSPQAAPANHRAQPGTLPAT